MLPRYRSRGDEPSERIREIEQTRPDERIIIIITITVIIIVILSSVGPFRFDAAFSLFS